MLNPNDNWRDAMKGVSADIDDEFGERLIITPCTAPPNRQAEPSGPSISIMGVFRYRSVEAFPTRNGIAVDTRMPQVSFDRDRLPFPPEPGTRVQRVDDGDLFEVTRSLPDGVSRVVCHLNQLGLADPT